MATAVGRKRRRGQREWSARLQTTTTPLLRVQFSQTRHLRLDKRMIFPTMFLHTQCNEKWQGYGCSKGLRKARRFTRMIMTRHRTKREGHWWDQHRKRRGWSCTKLHGASSCSWEQASKSRHHGRWSKGELSAEARLAPETRDHRPHNRYRLLVSLPNNRLLQS